MYVYYNLNPEQKMNGDCVVRAIGTLLNKKWESVFIKICLQGLVMHDMPSSNVVWGAYLYKNGFRRHIIPDTYPNIYTIKRFCEDNPTGSFLVCADKHVVAVIDGNYYDTMDSGEEVPLYYWRKEE